MTTARDSQQHRPSRRRVIILITKADVGGAQMHVLQILRELGTEFEFLLVTGAPDFLTRRAEALGVEIRIVPHLTRPIRPIDDVRAIAAIYRLVREWRPDLVHAHSFKAGIVGRLAALAAGTPCLFTAHGWSFTKGAPFLQQVIGLGIESILCRLCVGVVTISRYDYELAEKWRVGSTSRRHLVLNAADQTPGSAIPDNQSGKLLSIGRLTPVKNHILLIRALALLPVEVTLTIIGEGPERSALNAMVAELGLEERVALVGEVTETAPYLAAATVFVLGSDFEGLPLSILEAMSAGLPVVATDVGGVSEAVIDHETGYLVPRRDVRALVGRLRQLHNEPTLRVTMGRRGRERFDSRFTVSRFRQEMRAVYARI